MLVLAALSLVNALSLYEYQCPHPAQWNLRSRILCKSEQNRISYSCLYDEHNNTYIESCSENADFVRPGKYRFSTKFYVSLQNRICYLILPWKPYLKAMFSLNDYHCCFHSLEIWPTTNIIVIPSLLTNYQMTYISGFIWIKQMYECILAIKTLWIII